MLGAIIGDIIGSRWEFNRTNDYNFPLFSPYNGFTDDTICTIAVADALLEGRDFGESLHDWCRRHPVAKGGYGGGFRRWIQSDNPRPYGSYGNGSAMRVSPVGWGFDDADDVLKYARLSAECTHNHPEGIKGAQAVAIAIADCRRMRRNFNVRNLTPKDILRYGLSRAVDCLDLPGGPENFSIDLDRYRNVFDETCQGTVPPALWIVMHSKSYEDAVRRAVSLGADADTIGDIAGAIAEAIWGIPEWIKLRGMAYLSPEMKDVLSRFRRRVTA